MKLQEYTITVPEYVGWAKRKVDMVYSTKAESLDEATDNIYTSLKNYGWSREQVKEALNG
jgi:hypothetical protein